MPAKTRKTNVLSVMHEVILTPSEWKRLLEIKNLRKPAIFIEALKGTGADEHSIDFDDEYPHSVAFSIPGTGDPQKAIEAIEALVAKPKPSKDKNLVHRSKV